MTDSFFNAVDVTSPEAPSYAAAVYHPPDFGEEIINDILQNDSVTGTYRDTSTAPEPSEDLLQPISQDEEDHNADHMLNMIYTDSRDRMGKSAETKLNCAMFHLNIFLKRYSKQLNEPFVDPRKLQLTVARTIESSPFDREPQWFNSMMGCFVDYLGRDAYKTGRKDCGRISQASADGYTSSLKVFYEKKFREIPVDISVFHGTQWSHLKRQLNAAFAEEARQTGSKLTDPHKASTEEDRRAIAVGSVWANNASGAEFFHVNNSMHHESGRCSEVSLNRWDRLTAVSVEELNYSYKTLQIDLDRQKNGVGQEIPIYIHRDTWAECYIFSTIYMIIMLQDLSDDYIFPSFSKCSKRQDAANKNDSKCSSMWTTFFTRLLPLFLMFDAALNKKLSSHHGKKSSNQIMANSSVVSGLAQIFRSGWIVRGLHSLMDYVVGSPVMSHHAGKAVSKWTNKIADVVVGGMPPSTTDVNTERESLHRFIHFLFVHDEESRISQSVRDILVMTAIYHYDDFTRVLQSKPSGEFADPRRHLFIARFQRALDQAGVSELTFRAWKKEVRDGFVNRNIISLPYPEIESRAGEGTRIESLNLDPRTFVEQTNNLVQSLNGLNGNYFKVKDQLTDVQEEVNSLTQQNNELSSAMTSLYAEQQKSNQLLHAIYQSLRSGHVADISISAPTVPPQAATVTPDVSPKKSSTENADVCVSSEKSSLIPFSVSSGFMKNVSIPLSEQYVFFFNYRAHAAYDEEKKSPEWNEMSKENRKRVTNRMQHLKEVVRFMVLYHGYVPNSAPIGDPKEYQAWLKHIKDASKEAEEKVHLLLVQELCVKPDTSPKNVKRGDLIKSVTFKACKDTRLSGQIPDYYFPDDAPDDILDFFDPNKKARKRKASELSEE